MAWLLWTILILFLTMYSILKTHENYFHLARTPVSRKQNPFFVDPVHQNIIRFPTSVPRTSIAELLEYLDLRTGAEVGVQGGSFASKTLMTWKSCQKFVLVDLWAHQKNYFDLANKRQYVQEKIMGHAIDNVKPWIKKMEICRNFSETCAERYPDNFFDYVYIDARHDFKGVYADLKAWYPKIRSGGIMAGHDYMSAIEVPAQDWTIQFDGTIDYGRQAARGAVNLFFAEKEQYITFPDWPNEFRSWVIRKTVGERKSNGVLHFINLSCFYSEEKEECRLVPREFAKNVMMWEMRNLDCISIVWTPGLVRSLFPHLSSLSDTVYKKNIHHFEERIKLEVLHKMGGVFVRAETIPLTGIHDYIHALSTGKIVVACQQRSSREDIVSAGNRCLRLSPVLLGSQKGNKDLLLLSRIHRRTFKLKDSNMNASSGLLPMLVQKVNHVVVNTDVSLPCKIEEFSEKCVALDMLSTKE